MNLWTVFLTGLLTGGLSCMAVQGGLLAATLAQKEEERIRTQLSANRAWPIFAFLIAKIIAYTILGALLGYFGSFFQLSITTQIFLQITVAVFMIGTALNLLNVHPLFRYFAVPAPRFLLRIIRKESRSGNYFAPALLGALTVFIPCGTTQAMMALALATANPFYSAMIMFAFTLGTAPVFFILGYLTTRLSNLFQTSFSKVAAAAIIILAIFNINAALILSGSNFNLTYVWRDFSCTVLSNCPSKVFAAEEKATSTPIIYFNSGGYSPDTVTVKRGSQVTLNLINKNGEGCIQSFVIPKLNIQKIVRTGTKTSVSFQAPETPGDLTFSCSMGMYSGVINVI
ncbi:hypothetical protein A3J20_05635 [Candidatus Gottesmanbacteria bacterium RIFCSPLOWO2_02_FULL_42_29]|uniref:Urease accessory protein UreH-like transmembrane domain-containing protein n=2 Tax=Candidatus Gottesmaniibacteriota TaxID=1752720 RepID=A0A1F6BAK5_9BACT|nr:MAG: putative membrane protein [Candidatus Gottesmanbacteria bacterium GW2011_GWA2_42_18]KKS74285.1 MAG: putative membrane protein [Candidatus Gottesmanbacteria bacterium GW2011_GWC2_42_8]OGG09912.1 MAG: hypothetical protein A2781_04490 [Candidatus Gottesmanbacteria bacterium RIFCSPHIGHO2_01_FULL_42_27]OGG33989.1 MAG: hypothetical protein A2968_05800 [Candidatus Gottesmanbacteria bacterium RIFCSPLOWO2_01_FULL_42_22]OGG34448.1 MAG: hypothetical protein A3G68_04550 [Candidatus Gottesmanbacteri